MPGPPLIAPMLATPGVLPGGGTDHSWGYEFKWDGVRAVGYTDGGGLRLYSRNDRDITVSYPDVAGLGQALAGRRLVLDGELVALDEQGRPSFGTLAHRMHVRDGHEAARLASTSPVTYLLFDVLQLDGRSLLRTPYADRRSALEALGLTGPSWQTPPAFTGGGADVLAASRSGGLEGVVAKRLASSYLPGRRSPDWVKIKNIRTQDVVVGGWTAGTGRRAGSLGALLLGVRGDDGLVFAGKVGTGFSDAALTQLRDLLEPLGQADSPFIAVPREISRLARWVQPVLVGEVVFTEWTADGRLRHPAWRGLRADVSVEEVVREQQ